MRKFKRTTSTLALFFACFGLVTHASADVISASGLIKFTGSIVEPSCITTVQSTGWRVNECPPFGRLSQVAVEPIDNFGMPVRVKRTTSADELADYTLLDAKGAVVTAGSYILIFTSI
ncbi:hypothetical protein DQ397_004231 [Pseudomonas sp. CK-NBRI-02]|uniref:hypothetical protein n=1 Tax=Pseudomonas sp. CK-NBRI-02 TaxID=2249759 RepID=UPI0011E70910|nr:hypothetical protein [Pseudomonas sp. CK-NBRI-02]TYO70648.1 hypothetical protein DQ397_004231 [Pseudomonas sp. CK-NBRI-02]